MTNILNALVIGGLAVSASVATVTITGEDTVPIKEAIGVGIFLGGLLLWLDRQFSSVRGMIKREHMLNKEKRLWVRASIHHISRHLGIEPLPENERDEESTK